MLNRESCCNFVCIDIDIPKAAIKEVDFKNPDAKYSYLKNKLNAVLEALSGPLKVPPEAILLEETGGRGYHIWVFFTEEMQGQTAVAFGEAIKKQLAFEVEFFPKQGRLSSRRKFGNLIKLPLGLHRKHNSWSCFFSLLTEEPRFIIDKEENIAFLRSLVPVDPKAIEKVVKPFAEELSIHEEAIVFVGGSDQERPQFEGSPNQLVSQCAVIHKLRMKAESGDRFSRTEAFYFANIMISVPGGIDFIHDTMRLSFKSDYNQVRTDDEIEKITPLYPPSCLTLVSKHICPCYCKEGVRKRNEDPLVFGTSPCSVWLRRRPTLPVVDTANLLERIGTSENLKRAYFQAKYYHKNEDALFFDSFDFEHFENRIDANCKLLAKALVEKIEIPFAGYPEIFIL